MGNKPSADSKNYHICTNCVMDTSDPQITFDKNGRCDFCENYYNTILPSWHKGEKKETLLEIAERIKRETKGKKYNCIIGISGGVDSSFLTHIATRVMGLKPLLYSVDTGWSLKLADENIESCLRLILTCILWL